MDNTTLYGQDDGLALNESNGVGPWSVDKYAMHRLYCQLFSIGMKSKWRRTYIDLYAGAGLSRLENGDILLGSPLIALSVDAPFDQYIFCEQDTDKLKALEIRIKRDFPTANALFVSGDCNVKIDEIIQAMPPQNLGLCFVDPYDLSIKFETLKRLANARRVDFLCLLALRMDAARNPINYEKTTSSKVEKFVGSSDWRTRWSKAKNQGEDFARFLAVEFGQRMESIEYLATPLHTMKEVRTNGNVPLYHLALFSKHKTAFHYWEQVLEYSTAQRNLFK